MTASRWSVMVGRMRTDAIVVLGCRVLPSGRPTRAAAKRAARAADAYHEGVASHVIASGGRRWGDMIEAETLHAELARRGVPELSITRELWSLTTHENAIFSAELLRRRGAGSVTVVTCDWHMDRALMNFRATGLDAWPFPSEGIARGLVGEAYRFGHERICRWLDTRAMKRKTSMTCIFRTNYHREPWTGDRAQ